MGKPNIIWIALESVRFDHTSMSGYKRDTTPEIANLSHDPNGRSFNNAFSHGIYTRSSTASVLTGTYPSRHGVGIHHTHGNVPNELATVPELLQGEGYQTACFSPNPHINSESGLDRGFEAFRYFRRGHLTDAASYSSLLKYFFNLRKHSAGYTRDTVQHSTDYLMDLEAKRLLDDYVSDDSPFFMYVHHGDTHCPYSPPLPLRDEFTGEIEMSTDEAYMISHDLHANLYKNFACGADYSSEEWDGIISMYDAAIKYSDQLVGDLVSTILEEADDTIVVISGDHGELFGEHDMIEHRLTTHDAVAHVPLVVYGSDAIVEADTDIVQHIDIIRTILEEEVGIESDQLQGHNLSEQSRDCAFIQRGYERYRKTLDRLEEFEMQLDLSHFHDATVHAARTDEFKLLQSTERTELFELPNESTDVSKEYPETLEELSHKIDSFLEDEGDPIETGDNEGEMSDEVREHLDDLGYLSS